MPLPPTIRLRAVIDAIDPAKDIDGIHPLNAGLLRLGYDGFLPATAHAADRDPPPVRDRDRRPRRGRHRPVRGRRDAGRVPAGQGGRDGHGLPLADARPRRPRRAAPTSSSWPPAIPASSPARCSSRARSSSTSGSTWSTATSSATSTSRRPSRSPRRSRPCPAASARSPTRILLTHLIRAAERQAPTACDRWPRSAPPRPVRRRSMSFPSDLEIARGGHAAADHRRRPRPRHRRQRARAVRTDARPR